MDKLRPKKGSQGTVILTNNDNYTVKIYTKAGKNLKMLIKIINFFINTNRIIQCMDFQMARIHENYFFDSTAV